MLQFKINPAELFNIV
ncbi:MAG: hypothetical protein QMB24_10870 [Spirosomataceae bacterium]